MTQELAAQHDTALPLRELSALALRANGSGMELLAVGDEDFAVITAALDSEGKAGVTKRKNLPTGDIDISDGSGFEGIAVDAARVFVLQEEQSRLHVFDASLKTLVQSIELVVSPDHPEIGETWQAKPNKRGEGLLLLKHGHVLVGRQSEAFLIEFGPPGSDALGVSAETVLGPGESFELPAAELVPLTQWRLEFPSVNDLALGEDGRVYVVSSKGRAIAKLPERLTPGKTVVLEDPWTLAGTLPPGEPDDLDPKPEGLVLVGGKPLVAFDTKFAGDNLLLFDAI